MSENTEKRRTRLTKKAVETFESIKRVDDEGHEWWSSRDLARILTYADYRNFLNVIEKGKEACENGGVSNKYYFVDITDMIKLGKGAEMNPDNARRNVG